MLTTTRPVPKKRASVILPYADGSTNVSRLRAARSASRSSRTAAATGGVMTDVKTKQASVASATAFLQAFAETP
jgi:hypothetical protein